MSVRIAERADAAVRQTSSGFSAKLLLFLRRSFPKIEVSAILEFNVRARTFSEHRVLVLSVEMIERRSEPRKSTNLRGLARYGASNHDKPCSVSNLSTRGAGLSFASTFGIPMQFQLLIDGESQPRHCRVIWTEGKRLGVQFE